MFNKRAFKALLILKNKSMEDVAKFLGISRTTLYRKMNGESDFFLNEIQKLCEFLQIENPMEIFFTNELAYTQKETSKEV